MKKLIGILAATLMIVFAMPAQAQLKMGLKGGLNLSKLSFSSSDLKGDNQTGFFVGPTAEFTVPLIGIGFDISALYSQKSLDDDASLKSVEIPVNLKWTYGLGSILGVFVAVGPQFGFNIGHKSYGYYDLKENYTSFNVGAGVKLIKHLQIGANYNFCLGNIGTYDGEKVKTNTWQISLAYMF